MSSNHRSARINDRESTGKKRSRHSDSQHTGKKRKEGKKGFRVLDDDADEDVWIEKNIDIDGNNVSFPFQFIVVPAGTPVESGLPQPVFTAVRKFNFICCFRLS